MTFFYIEPTLYNICCISCEHTWSYVSYMSFGMNYVRTLIPILINGQIREVQIDLHSCFKIVWNVIIMSLLQLIIIHIVMALFICINVCIYEVSTNQYEIWQDCWCFSWNFKWSFMFLRLPLIGYLMRMNTHQTITNSFTKTSFKHYILSFDSIHYIRLSTNICHFQSVYN